VLVKICLYDKSEVLFCQQIIRDFCILSHGQVVIDKKEGVSYH